MSDLVFRRAREIQVEERLAAARYRPPALRAMASAGSPSNDVSSPVPSAEVGPLPPSNLPAGFRRARAGTLPSNVQLAAAQRYAANETIPDLTATTEHFLERQASQTTSLSTSTANLKIEQRIFFIHVREVLPTSPSRHPRS